MATIKEKVFEIVQEQPDDSSFDEILRELAFSRRVERGLDDSRQGQGYFQRRNAASNPRMAEISWTAEAG